MKTRTVDVKVLPDGSGRVRIHWFEKMEDGPASTNGGVLQSSAMPVYVAGTRGRIVCMPNETNVLPREINGVVRVVCNSDDPRAVNCPECMATESFKKRMQLIEEMVAHPEKFRTAAVPEEVMQGG